jgi:uncharacterized protein DUF4288
MAFIPEDAEWYLAEIVQEIFVEGDSRNVVHTNVVLIRADAPEDAYQKALELGDSKNISYENPEGKHVEIRFRGLHDLQVIHDQLEHGAELTYSEDIGMDEEALQRWVSSKEELGVFAPITPTAGPDYRSGEVVKELEAMQKDSPVD